MPTYHVLSTAAIDIGSPIVPITLENTSTSTQTNVPFTFGQVFSEGHLPSAGAAVELRAPDGTVVPCQLNVKATHSDSSVKHAILSAIVPSMAASSSVKYNIVRKASPATGAAPVPADYPDMSAVVVVKDTGTLISGPTAGTAYTANANTLLTQGKYTTWLSGPLCSEWLVRAPLVASNGDVHPNLHVRFNIRVYKGLQKAKIDFIVENTWVKPKAVVTGNAPFEAVSVLPNIYSYTISVAGDVVDSRPSRAYHTVRLNANTNGAYNGNTTNVPNDSTVYTATMTIDGVAKNISVVGSAIQNFGQLFSAINTQLGGMATCSIAENNLGFMIQSNTTGASSTVAIDGGTLYPVLKAFTPLNRAIQGGEYVHHPKKRWKKTFWWNGAPPLHIRHDKAYLIASKAVPNYTASLVGNPTAITNRWNEILSKSDLGAYGIAKPYMSDTGASPGIGILPEWAATYIVNQGKTAKDTMLLQADLQGSYAAHCRDYDTDAPLSISKWPYATMIGTGSDATNPATGNSELLPSAGNPAGVPSNMSIADVAHHPDFCYVPYLVTGDHFYMEGLLFYAMYCCLQQNAHANYRSGGKVLFRTDQTRAEAWSMRTIVHNLYILPDNHPSRAGLSYVLASNVAWYNEQFASPNAPQRSIFGRLRQIIYPASGVLANGVNAGYNTAVGLFQEDFYTQAIGRAIELGFEEFLPMLAYRNLNIKGRLTSGPDWCWRMATTYELRVREASASPEYTSWAEAYQKSMPANVLAAACTSTAMDNIIGYGSGSMWGYPTLTDGFPANLQPAVAYCAMFNMDSADDAWLVLDSRSPKADYDTGPQFAIEPRTFTGFESVSPQPQGTLPTNFYSVLVNQPMYFGKS